MNKNGVINRSRQKIIEVSLATPSNPTSNPNNSSILPQGITLKPTEQATKNIPMELLPSIKHLSLYGQRRFAMGMLTSIRNTEKLIENLMPFINSNPTLVDVILVAKAETESLRLEALKLANIEPDPDQ